MSIAYCLIIILTAVNVWPMRGQVVYDPVLLTDSTLSNQPSTQIFSQNSHLNSPEPSLYCSYTLSYFLTHMHNSALTLLLCKIKEYHNIMCLSELLKHHKMLDEHCALLYCQKLHRTDENCCSERYHLNWF